MVISMNLKTDNIRCVTYKDYFFLQYHRTDIYRKPLLYWLKQFNIEDYWIYKMTNKQKLVSIEDVIKFNNAGYIFFNKDKYKKEHIENWLVNFYYKAGRSGISYMNKPTPPFSPQKIIIKK